SFLTSRRPQPSTLFPYTTLFRSARDSGGDLGYLDGVRQPGAEMIVLGGDEHLTLPGQAPPGTRVLDAVEVALEAQPERIGFLGEDRKSTRLNSSHSQISYAVFCL